MFQLNVFCETDVPVHFVLLHYVYWPFTIHLLLQYEYGAFSEESKLEFMVFRGKLIFYRGSNVINVKEMMNLPYILLIISARTKWRNLRRLTETQRFSQT